MTEFTLKRVNLPQKFQSLIEDEEELLIIKNQNMIYGQRHINIMMDIKLQETLGIMLLIIGIGVWLQQKMDKVKIVVIM